MRANRRLQADDRGVSEVIGAILVFGLAVALLAVLQAQAIPAANEEVEFNHNQEVQGDLVKFQEVASRSASQGTTESVKVQMGATYPSRLLFFNPRNPSGTLKTSTEQSASIDNVKAVDPTIAKYIDGSTDDLETKRIQYRPNYNEYRNPPTTVLEYGVLYNDFGERTLIQDKGNVVSGNNIDLMFFTGNISRGTGGALSVSARPASAPARTVTVSPKDQSERVNVTLPSKLSPDEWEDILSEEIQDGNVLGVEDGPGSTVVIQLDPNVNRYSIRMPVIGVGSNVKQPEARYIIGAHGESGTVPLTGVKEVTFEVRDKYNNPVRGEEVNVTLDGASGDLNTNSVTTNEEGRATVLYSAPSDGDVPFTVPIKASFNSDPSQSFNPQDDPADVEYEMTVTQIQGSVGPEPSIDNFDVTDDSQGAVLGLLGEDEIGYVVDWEASISSNDADAKLDTVELRLINNETRRIADSVTYDIRGQMTAQDTDVQLVDDQGACGDEYLVQIVVKSTGDRSVAQKQEDIACN